MKQKELARWLKAIDIVAAALGLLLCALVAPVIGQGLVEQAPELKGWFWPTLVYIWIMAVPIYVCLWHAWKMFTEISRNNSFSLVNARHLRSMSQLALVETALIFLAALVLLVKNLLHPSLLFGLLLALFVMIALSMVTAALSHLVEKAYLLKQENDLTV